jgi:hypothetical protein
MSPVSTETQIPELIATSLKLSKPIDSSNGTGVKVEYEVSENYEGKYQFSPIKEHQVSRAMTKR